MPERLPFFAQRRALAQFAEAIGCASSALGRDGSGDPVISGHRGDVRALPRGLEIFVAASSPTAWAEAKSRLAFAMLIKDGAEEGLFWLNRRPIPEEARAILDCLGIEPKAEPSCKQVGARSAPRAPRLRGDLAFW